MYTVRIEGEIQIPGGTYPYVENMTVEDIILMANGFTNLLPQELM